MAIQTSAVQKDASPDQPLRTEPRVPTELPVELTIARTPLPITATLVNISASGMGLNLDHQVLRGEIACVKLDIGSFFGEIRHCSKIGSSYRAGLKLHEFIPREDEAQSAGNRSTAQ